MAFLIINNDQYEIKSIDKLHYTFPAGLSHDRRHKSDVRHDAAAGFESFVSCEFEAHWKPEAMYPFSKSKE